jgi:hypothetical protein
MAYIKKILIRSGGLEEDVDKFFLQFCCTALYLLVMDCSFGCGRESSPNII